MSKKRATNLGEIQATRIALVDGSCNERIVMELDNGQPTITLLGLNGSMQVQLGIVAVHDNSAELLLGSPDGRTIGRFVVDGNPNREGSATMLFGGGHKRIVASTNLPRALPSLDLIDEAGNNVAHLPTANLKSSAKTKAKLNKAVGPERIKKK